MESNVHLGLKRLSLAYLAWRGCAAAAAEVQCPLCRYRVDVAGFCDVGRNGEGRSVRIEPKTLMIECKQSREDFLRDCDEAEPLLCYREQLEAFCESIREHRVKQLEPHLRQTGTSLFAAMDDWDFNSSQLPSHRKVLRQLRRVDERLHGQTKFFVMAKYRLADELYLATPAGMIKPRELPRGWGLLEWDMDRVTTAIGVHRGCDAALEGLRIAVEATAPSCKPEYRQRLLRNIAVAATRQNFNPIHRG